MPFCFVAGDGVWLGLARLETTAICAHAIGDEERSLAKRAWSSLELTVCLTLAECLCKPKALRHAFAVEAGQKAIPPNIVQLWLGHACIETTAIHASAIGDEERNLAGRAWSSLELALPDRTN
ncbi:MAG TPA: hypothetical protein VMF67_06280 [Rhizomicrobium sp.]|nr:hypothetical protein [Rhizomicrobium sp.]